METPKFLSDSDFAHVVRHAPLVSIDLIIRNADNRMLVGLRTNEPAKDAYFVPGGVIRKNEAIAAAFARILKAETALERAFDQARFHGVFEHFYAANRFGDPGYGTHYVVLAYELRIGAEATIKPDAQHSQMRWMSNDDIRRSEKVHPNTQAYVSNP